jgi:16S rRNA (cytidine1402-2'-O)-methyltransferase
LASVLGARPAALARELTKLHEDVVRGSLAELAERFAEVEPKGEVVLVVGPPGEGVTTDADIEAQLQAALKSWSVRDAAKVVSDALKVPKARVYELALKVKQRETD